MRDLGRSMSGVRRVLSHSDKWTGRYRFGGCTLRGSPGPARWLLPFWDECAGDGRIWGRNSRGSPKLAGRPSPFSDKCAGGGRAGCRGLRPAPGSARRFWPCSDIFVGRCRIGRGGPCWSPRRSLRLLPLRTDAGGRCWAGWGGGIRGSGEPGSASAPTATDALFREAAPSRHHARAPTAKQIIILYFCCGCKIGVLLGRLGMGRGTWPEPLVLASLFCSPSKSVRYFAKSDWNGGRGGR